jgi:hypothetical protein
MQTLTYSLDPGAPGGASVHPTTGAFSWTPPSNASGSYQITLRVSDGAAAEMTDAQTFAIVLLTNMTGTVATAISAGAVWRYQDNGIDQGFTWRNLGFNDSSWKTGAAPLGYGLADVATTTSFGANPSNKHVTTYFRRSFFVPDARLVQRLILRMARDDGAVVYLNGSELWRENMPGGAIAFLTPASSEVSGAAQTQFVERVASPVGLITGTNVIAVELHQDSIVTPDARFDFELQVDSLVPANARLVASRPGNATLLAWPMSAGLFRPFYATNLSPPVVWQQVTNAPTLSNGQWSVTLSLFTNANMFFRLQTP